MLKPEILDPQGRAVEGALARLGLSGVSSVRQGKRFEIELDGDLDLDRLDQVRQHAQRLLANPVIEDYTVTVIDEGGVER
jgi:phosphoribosylformylglycinamidine synthase